MYHSWGCYYCHRLSFVREVENESVLLITLKIFVHLCLRWCGTTQLRGIRGFILQSRKTVMDTVDWTEVIQLRGGDGFELQLSNLSKKKKKKLVKNAAWWSCCGSKVLNFFVWLPDTLGTRAILYISTFWSAVWGQKWLGSCRKKYNDIFLDLCFPERQNKIDQSNVT